MLLSTVKMNVFLQKMLKMGDDDQHESNTTMKPTQQQVERSPSRGKSKWIRKFTNSTGVSKSVSTPSRVETVPKSMPVQRSVTLPQEASDIDIIAKDFDENLISLRNRSNETLTSNGKYVKKMVAVFEQRTGNFSKTKIEMAENRMKRRSLPLIPEHRKDSVQHFLNETYIISSPKRKFYKNKNSNCSASSSNLADTVLDPTFFNTLPEASSRMDETLDISSSELNESQKSTIVNKITPSISRMTCVSPKLSSKQESPSKSSLNKMTGKFQRTSFIKMADKLQNKLSDKFKWNSSIKIDETIDKNCSYNEMNDTIEQTHFVDKMTDNFDKVSLNKMDSTINTPNETLDLTQSLNDETDNMTETSLNETANGPIVEDTNEVIKLDALSYSKISFDFCRTVYNKMAEDDRELIVPEQINETIDTSECSFSMNEELSSTPMKPISERTPKIVGAFLKKPIEVEDTAIDWIPITGKKLPRKRSFKELLSILTGKKSKGDSLYCSQSQNNVNEEAPVREHHDSGFSEKSTSSASLQSLTSIVDILQQQHLNQQRETTNVDKRCSLTTFQAPKETEDIIEEEETEKKEEEDKFSDSSSLTKLVFEEIPRSEVRLSLGPSFPLKDKVMRVHLSSSSIASSVASGNINDYSLESDHDLEALPKHPFVSEKKEEEAELKKVVYDTPRRYISISQPGLHDKTVFSTSQDNLPYYDVPVIRIPPRPKSCIYEDAIALKRTAMAFGSLVGSDFYAAQTDDEPHYATVKPRSRRVSPSRELLMSMEEIPQSCRTEAHYQVPNNRLASF